jgi:hypothetical protein
LPEAGEALAGAVSLVRQRAEVCVLVDPHLRCRNWLASRKEHMSPGQEEFPFEVPDDAGTDACPVRPDPRCPSTTSQDPRIKALDARLSQVLPSIDDPRLREDVCWSWLHAATECVPILISVPDGGSITR